VGQAPPNIISGLKPTLPDRIIQETKLQCWVCSSAKAKYW